MGFRTTLQIDDDVFMAARSLASARGLSIGTVISELARKGLRPSRPRLHRKGGFPTFAVSPDAAPLTPEAVRAALDE